MYETEHINSLENLKLNVTSHINDFYGNLLLVYFLIQDIAQIPTEVKVNQKFIVQRYSALVFSLDTTNMNNDEPSEEGVFMMQISP